VQTCIWPSWCHCHSLSLASVRSRLVLLFWYWLTQVVPDKGPLNVCVCPSCYIYIFYSPKLVVSTHVIYKNKVKKENKSLYVSYLTMRLHISQITLLFNEYLLINSSLHVATASAMSLTPHILIHTTAISEVLTLQIFLAHDTTTWFRDLNWRELTGHASRPYNNLGIHFVFHNLTTTSTDAASPSLPKIALNTR